MLKVIERVREFRALVKSVLWDEKAVNRTGPLLALEREARSGGVASSDAVYKLLLALREPFNTAKAMQPII